MPNSIQRIYRPNTANRISRYFCSLLAGLALVANLWGLFFCLLFFTSCAPSRSACERNYGPCGFAERDTVLKHVTILVPGATVTDTITLQEFIRDTALINVPVIVIDSTNRVAAKYWKDAYGKLYISCTAKTIIRDTIIKLEPSPQKRPPPTECPKTEWWKWILIGAGCGFLLAIIVKLALK